jgi:hypothetical protein
MRYLFTTTCRRLVVPQISICLGLSIGVLSSGMAAARPLPDSASFPRSNAVSDSVSPTSNSISDSTSNLVSDSVPVEPVAQQSAQVEPAPTEHPTEPALTEPATEPAPASAQPEPVPALQPTCVAGCNRTAQFVFRTPSGSIGLFSSNRAIAPVPAAPAAAPAAVAPTAVTPPNARDTGAHDTGARDTGARNQQFGVSPLSSPPAAVSVPTTDSDYQADSAQQTDSDYQAPFPPSSNPASPTAPAVPPVTPTAQPTAQVDFPMRRTPVTPPSLRIQGVYIYVGGDSSARARLVGVYPLTPNVQAGGSIDLTAGEGDLFDEDGEDGVSINELYLAASLRDLPNLRFVVGQLDLTSYFDRNSFAKDGETQFFNPVFQTNPALTAVGIGSRPGALVNWSITDDLEARTAIFSSDRSISDFELDGFAGELGLRLAENFIIRGTYATGRDGGSDTGFREIFSIRNGRGLREDDREEAYGVNAELFIPEIRMGIFGRYGRYENLEINEGGDTFVVGLTFLDLFLPDDRLGIGYGQELSNSGFREELGNGISDVGEIFYDFEVLPNLRLGFTLQALDDFSETVAGVRVRTVFDLLPRRSQ